jgi:RNA polymerase sigma-70 factor (ECF subfamily)
VPSDETACHAVTVVDDDLRPLLFSIAYRMLGSVADAEDVVQEAYLRRASVADPVESERAYMTTITSRLAIDVLRSARVRRETYVGDWLPEPLVEPEAPAVVEAEESVSLAMLVLLERLNPVERAVFVLRDSFDLEFAQIAAIVDRGEDNCRQILSRARRRVADERPRFDADPAERRALAARFLAAAREGDLQGLVAVLAPDAVLIGDGGGVARSIPHAMRGAAVIARALIAFYGQVDALGVTLEPAWVNGHPGFRSLDGDGRIVNVVGLDVVDGRIASIYSMLNPNKLGHLGETSELGLRPSRSAPPR